MYWEADKECMDREELEQLQLERLQSTLNRVYAHVPFYRKKFDALGISPEEIGSLSDLSRLPFTTKEDVRGNYPYGLFAVPLREVVRIHASSGSTETSSVVGYTRNDITMWSKLVARILVAGGVTKDDVVQVSFRYGSVHGGVRAALRRGAARRIGDPGLQREHRPPDPDHEGFQDDGAGVHPFLRDAGRRHDPRDGDPRFGALPQVRPLRGGAVVRKDAPGDPGRPRDRRHGQLRAVGSHRAGGLRRVPRAQRPAHQRGPLPRRGHRPEDPSTRAARPDGGARHHDADQGGVPDGPVPDPGSHQPPGGGLPVRADGAPDEPPGGQDGRDADHPRDESVPRQDRVPALRDRGERAELPDRDRPEGGDGRGHGPRRGRRGGVVRAGAPARREDGGDDPEAADPRAGGDGGREARGEGRPSSRSTGRRCASSISGNCRGPI